MLITVMAGWIVASMLTAAVWSTVARGGLAEDRRLGYLIDRH